MIQQRICNYFERNERLHVLFVFDKSDVIRTELADAQWDGGYVYEVFDGAWFNAKYSIEHEWKDKRVVLLFPSTAYPQTHEAMLSFPLLDILCANMEYKEEDYESFMQQYGIGRKHAALIQRNITEIMSKKLMAILNGHFSADTFSADVLCRGFLSSYLGEKSLLDWSDIVVRMIVLDMADEEKRRDDFYRRLRKNRDAAAAVDGKLSQVFGFSYSENSEVRMKRIAECLKYNALTWQLDTASSDPYKQYKTKDAARLAQMNKVLDAARTDMVYRQRFYTAMERFGTDIREETIVGIYGVDVDYRHLTEKLCWIIIRDLIGEKIYSDPEAVNSRVRELSLKMTDRGKVGTAWNMVSEMALYYAKAKTTGTLRLNSPDEYVRRYVSDYYLLDLHYRKTLEAYHEIVGLDTPIEQQLGEAKRKLDRDYAQLTNEINLEWMKCVRDREGLSRSLSLCKQEDFYAREVDARTKQVVIVCDAMRYDVAAELMQELAKEKHVAKLTAMRAMLPTETKYCKPALLPHGSLELRGDEMLVDGKPLPDAQSRTKHLERYRQQGLCVSYEEVMALSQDSQRALFKRPLVYVFYNGIDEASHSQSPFEVVRACRTGVEKLSALVKRLHATLNVTKVTLTTDHGFIYNDMPFEEKDKHPVKGECIEKKTRYFITENGNVQTEGVTVFPLEKVSGMSSEKPVFVAVPTGTNRLAAPGGYQFAHGGATLQEMILPVIRSVLKRDEKTQKVGVTLLSHGLQMVSSQLKVTLIQSEAVSMSVQSREIVCCVYDGDEPVTQPKTVMLDSHDAENLNNRIFSLTLTLCKSVSSSVLQLRVYDTKDGLNQLIRETVMNETLIDRDFD